MTASNFDACFADYLDYEGGFVDDPRDPGGATNMGITLGLMQRLNLDINRDGLVNVTECSSGTPCRGTRSPPAWSW
jgi:hypothetical protein